ncbi:hypothetical protein BGZ76_010104 [Entomortierella beljakovae]|nr:hypothetical protein BGZ76_010104 [Entomortierella beljakovae]
MNNPIQSQDYLKVLERAQEWIPSFTQLVQLYFIIITTAAILVATLPFFRDSLLSYGKLDYPTTSPDKDTTKNTTKTSPPIQDHESVQLVAALRSFRVPKPWFAHFYVFAPLWMIYLSLDLLLYTSFSPSSQQFIPEIIVPSYPKWSFLTLLNFLGIMPSASACSSVWTPPSTVLLVMSCYLIQVTRRWYESWFIERSSPKATMHVGHYIIGITFYAAVAPALWVDSFETWTQSCTSETHDQQAGLLGLFPQQAWIGLVIFIWGSIHQYNCHVILANLRKSSTANPSEPQRHEYKVPHGDWFEYLVTPHYSAEMVIYFAFYLIITATPLPILPNNVKPVVPTIAYVWVWVVVNLGIVARETDQWYRARFGNKYAEYGKNTTAGEHTQQRTTSKRAILVPYIY